MEPAPDFRSDNDRGKALTDAVVTRHKRYTSGYLPDESADDIDVEIKRLQLKTAKVKKRLARMRVKLAAIMANLYVILLCPIICRRTVCLPK